jgi:hypothetical protein
MFPHNNLNHFPFCLCNFFSFHLALSLIILHQVCPYYGFCGDDQPQFTILVNGIDATMVFEKCLCAMFGFQPKPLHISKDVAYDVNNNVSSSVY